MRFFWIFINEFCCFLKVIFLLMKVIILILKAKQYLSNQTSTKRKPLSLIVESTRQRTILNWWICRIFSLTTVTWSLYMPYASSDAWFHLCIKKRIINRQCLTNCMKMSSTFSRYNFPIILFVVHPFKLLLSWLIFVPGKHK